MRIRKTWLMGLPALLVAGVVWAQEAPPVTAESVMASVDVDKDGVVTRDEAARANPVLAQNWDRYDQNRDGKVDLAEMKKTFAAQPTAAARKSPSNRKMRRVVRNGQELFCSSEPVTGSRTQVVERCLTAEQIERERQSSQDMLGDLQKPAIESGSSPVQGGTVFN